MNVRVLPQRADTRGSGLSNLSTQAICQSNILCRVCVNLFMPACQKRSGNLSDVQAEAYFVGLLITKNK